MHTSNINSSIHVVLLNLSIPFKKGYDLIASVGSSILRTLGSTFKKASDHIQQAYKNFLLRKLEKLEHNLNSGQISKVTLGLTALIFFPSLMKRGLERDQIKHLYLVFAELLSKKYDLRATKEYLGWTLRLSIMQLKETDTQSFMASRVKQLSDRIAARQYDIVVRESGGHSKSYSLVDRVTHQPFAILKRSDPLYVSSFRNHVPSLLPMSPVWEHERIGYEQDQFFGFNHTPTTINVTNFAVDSDTTVTGTIQEFIPSSQDGSDCYNPRGARLLREIPHSHVHMMAISGIFKGLSAGHMGNYVVQMERQGSQESVKALYEIDLEEMLLPHNILSSDIEVVPVTKINERIALLRQTPTPEAATEIEQLGQKKIKVIQSIVLCRMWVLGLPQNEKPMDRALLMAITNPGFIPLLERYHREAAVNYPRMNTASWTAQLERVRIMQETCRHELNRDRITLTPRDLYFSIFGGEHLWKLAQAKRYPATVAFNNLISDPYQHLLKDFGCPENIPLCERLEKPKNNTQDARDITNFFRIIEGMEPLSFSS